MHPPDRTIAKSQCNNSLRFYGELWIFGLGGIRSRYRLLESKSASVAVPKCVIAETSKNLHLAVYMFEGGKGQTSRACFFYF